MVGKQWQPNLKLTILLPLLPSIGKPIVASLNRCWLRQNSRSMRCHVWKRKSKMKVKDNDFKTEPSPYQPTSTGNERCEAVTTKSEMTVFNSPYSHGDMLPLVELWVAGLLARWAFGFVGRKKNEVGGYGFCALFVVLFLAFNVQFLLQSQEEGFSISITNICMNLRPM